MGPRGAQWAVYLIHWETCVSAVTATDVPLPLAHPATANLELDGKLVLFHPLGMSSLVCYTSLFVGWLTLRALRNNTLLY